MKWLIMALLAFASVASAELAEEVHQVKIELSLTCPESAELKDLVELIDSQSGEVATYEEWVQNLMNGMDKLTVLLESEKIYQGGVSISQDVVPLQEAFPVRSDEN